MAGSECETEYELLLMFCEGFGNCVVLSDSYFLPFRQGLLSPADPPPLAAFMFLKILTPGENLSAFFLLLFVQSCCYIAACNLSLSLLLTSCISPGKTLLLLADQLTLISCFYSFVQN